MATHGLDILNAAKKQKAGGGNAPIAPKSPIRENFTASSIEELTNQYFGSDDTDLMEGVDYTLYPNGEKRPVYDPREEMKAIQNGEVFNNTSSKMPSAILESIRRNPLTMPTEGMQLEEAVMDSELQNKTLDIINKLESNDKKSKAYVNPNKEQPINESAGLYSPGIDTNELSQLIESIMDKKLKQYAGAIINESRKINGTGNTVKFMKLGETFTFMDDANNIYECKMVYKGKGKVKTK